MKKRKHIIITGEKGLGMSYSTIEMGSRNWYKRIQEDLIKEIEDCRPNEK